MRTFKLFLAFMLAFGTFTLANGQSQLYFAVDAEPFNKHTGEGGHSPIDDIRLDDPRGATKDYIMTGYSGFIFYIEIEEAGNYDLSLWGCSGNKVITNTGALCINQAHTDVPGVDPGNNRYTVMFTWPYSYDEGAVRKFEKLTFATNYYFTAGQHYIVYDSWDPGTYSHQRICAIEVEPSVPSSVKEFDTAKSEIIVSNGTAIVTPADAGNYDLNIFSLSGSKVWSQSALSEKTEVSGLAKGVYIFQVNTLSGTDKQKVIIR